MQHRSRERSRDRKVYEKRIRAPRTCPETHTYFDIIRDVYAASVTKTAWFERIRYLGRAQPAFLTLLEP